MNSKKNERFLNLSLDQVMSNRFARYSKYIIQDRALPDVRDGLKPVQRRILYSMNELGLFYNKSFKKSARVVGDVIGKYHPHGDSSIYEALVRMSQDWKINMTLIEVHGNNGSIDDDPAAAMRYTETRLSKISNHLLNNIKRNTVIFAPNFDDSEIEPTVLPALFPNLLVNGAKGIAAGYATEMPPHNLGEVIDAIIAKIKNPNINLNTILKYIKGPDFPTGAIVQNKDGIYQAFEKGKGKILIRSKYKISILKTHSSITITEIPYGVNKAKLVREIDEIKFNNKIEGIKKVRDESDRNGISIYIELSSKIDVNAILNYLLTKTEMQIYYNYNNIAIKDRIPTQMGINDLLDSYLKHQKVIQIKALNYDLAKDKKRHEIIQGLVMVANNTKDVIDVIRKTSGSKQGVINVLKNNFQFTNIQAKAIAELHIYRLSKTNQSMYIQEIEVLKKRINKTKEILKSQDKFNFYLIKLLKTLKNEHILPRKTKIEESMSQISVNMEALIKHEAIWIGISKEGYIKRFSNRTYESNNLHDYFIKKNDVLIYLQLINTQYKLIVFTNKGKYFLIPVHKIIETKFKNVGKHINDFAIMSHDEYIIEAVAVKNFDTNAYISMITKKGKGKRVKISDFKVSRFKKTHRIIKLAENDKLISITITNGFKQLIIITKDGRATKYLETQLSIQGVKSYGIKAINLANSEVVAITSGTNQEILGLVSNRGGVKRIKINSIKPMSKTTKGKLLFKIIKSNNHIILDSKVVMPHYNIIFSKNKIIVHKFNKINITSSNEGFSLLGPSNHGALINTHQIIDKNDPYFAVSSDLLNDDKFKEAENVINDASQISIDDLLKDI